MEVYIEVYGSGNECYFKVFKKSQGPKETILKDNSDNYWQTEPDITEGILPVEEARILIEVDGEEVYDGPLSESGVNIENISEEDEVTVSSFLEMGEGSIVLFWGHGGVVNFSLRGEMDDFETAMINIYTSNAISHEAFSGSEFIISLECDEIEVEDEDAWFDPKMGYWGPHVAE